VRSTRLGLHRPRGESSAAPMGSVFHQTRQGSVDNPHLTCEILFIKRAYTPLRLMKTRFLKKFSNDCPLAGKECSRIWARRKKGYISIEQILLLSRNNARHVGLPLDTHPQAIKMALAFKCVPQQFWTKTVVEKPAVDV